MNRPLNDREALVAALAAEAGAGRAEAPEPEELLDFLAGRLGPEDERRIERSLVADPAVARALVDLADLAAAGETRENAPAELAARAGWRELRGRLRPAGARTPWLPLLSAVAATLLVTTVGLSWRLWTLGVARGLPVANLRSLELTATRGDAAAAVELEPGAPLRLVLLPAEECPVYTAEIVGPRPAQRRTVSGLERDELGRLTLLLPGEPGDYQLRLSGCEPSRELEQHRFSIREPRAGAGADGG